LAKPEADGFVSTLACRTHLRGIRLQS
jgi:hypothetical protein